MNKLITISIFLLAFFSVKGQNFELIDDSIGLYKLENYVNTVLGFEKDSMIPDSTPYNYRIRYRTSCRFSETLGLRSDGGAVYKTKGKSFTKKLSDVDSTSEFVVISSSDTNQQNGLYLCAEKPSKSLVRELVSISKDSTSHAEDYITTNLIMSSNVKSAQIGYNVFMLGISYDDGRFLIIERSHIWGIGSQTSAGTTETFFLEKNCDHGHECCQDDCECCTDKMFRRYHGFEDTIRDVVNIHFEDSIKEEEKRFELFNLKLRNYIDSLYSSQKNILKSVGATYKGIKPSFCENFTLKWVSHLGVDFKATHTKKNSKDLCDRLSYCEKINAKHRRKKNSYGVINYSFEFIGMEYVIITEHTATAIDRQTTFYYQREE
jgi:hypothetical protein